MRGPFVEANSAVTVRPKRSRKRLAERRRGEISRTTLHSLLVPALLLDAAAIWCGAVGDHRWIAVIAGLVALTWLRLGLRPPLGHPGVLVSAWCLAVAIAGSIVFLVGCATHQAIDLRTVMALVLAPLPGQLLLRALKPGRVTAPACVLDHPMARATKRTVDLVGCLVLAPLVIPLIGVLSLVVWLTGGRPVFYSQVRLTIGGRPFRIWKLRSMVRDAEPANKAVWPLDDDPRITRIGRFLRRFWLDETPQLWNILNGDMSFVGPRPERPEFVEVFSKDVPMYGERLAVHAGLTGLAQVSGMIGNTSIRRRLALDRLYIRAWTPGLDLWIMGRTVWSAIRRLRKR